MREAGGAELRLFVPASQVAASEAFVAGAPARARKTQESYDLF
jgi:hypothetical protein